MSVYPDEPVSVDGFEYLDDLHLTRKIQAVQRRCCEDAKYVLAKQYRCKIAVSGVGGSRELEVAVPKGFLTDLCSVPPLARWLVSRVGPHLEACIVHDWLYSAWEVEGIRPKQRMRSFADDVLRAAMAEAKVGCRQQSMIDRAVRWFGNPAFRRQDRTLVLNS